MSDVQTDTESTRSSRNKKQEFEILIKKNMKRAYFSAYGILGSHDSAMELSQRAFIRAYRNFNRYDRSKNFFAWYYKILKNLCLNFIRDNKNRKEEPILEYKDKGTQAETPQQIIEKEEMKQLLQKALDELDFGEREIIILREFEGHSYKEIAEMLNVPEGTVMSRLFYARKKLAGKMKKVMK